MVGSSDGYKYIQLSMSTYFPITESTVHIFPVTDGDVAITELRRWLEERSYCSHGSRMLRMEITDIEPILDHMEKMASGDPMIVYPAESDITDSVMQM